MFGRQKLLDAIEGILKRHTTEQSWHVRRLERELLDARTWVRKVRATNSFLRRDRRRLRQLLDANDIPWVRETPQG